MQNLIFEKWKLSQALNQLVHLTLLELEFF